MRLKINKKHKQNQHHNMIKQGKIKNILIDTRNKMSTTLTTQPNIKQHKQTQQIQETKKGKTNLHKAHKTKHTKKKEKKRSKEIRKETQIQTTT